MSRLNHALLLIIASGWPEVTDRCMHLQGIAGADRQPPVLDTTTAPLQPDAAWQLAQR